MTETADAVHVPGHVLERVIGRGATSVVWAGRDPAGRRVAVKVPRPGQDGVDRLQSTAERQVLTALRHDHLVTLRAIVPLPDGRVVTVFDLVDGASLRATVHARGHLRPGETVTVLTPVCEAVAALHRAGVTHGDISPGNVLVTADGRPLLADLGAARVAGTGGAVLGTPGFIAPEVLSGAAPTPRSDVYSLGALAWFCLTGRGAPDTPIRLGLDEITAQVGRELAEVVARCIDPDPSVRPPAGDLGGLVYAAAEAEAIEVVVGADEASALTHRIRQNAATAPTDEAPGRKGLRVRFDDLRMRLSGTPRSRRPGWLPTLAVAMFVLALLTAGYTWSERSGRLAESAPTWVRGPSDAAPRSTPTPSTADDVEVTTDPEAPRTRPADLLRALAERRLSLLVRRDPGALGSVHRAGSSSWRADAAVLAELERGGHRYDGLAVGALQAEPVTVDGDHAVLRGRIDLTAYTVVEASGRRTLRPATDGEVLDFSLSRTAQGWRLEEVNEPAST